MSNPALSQPGQVVGPGVTPATPFLDGLFGKFWPEQSVPATPRLVVAGLVAGLVAAVVLPFRAPGIGTFLVLVVIAAVVAAADRRLRTPYHLAAAGLCLLLVSTVFVRDAAWIVTLCVPRARWQSRPSPRAARSPACWSPRRHLRSPRCVGSRGWAGR